MAELPVLVYPHPTLKKNSKRLRKVTEDTKQLLLDMAETMSSAYGLGLAAPQVGVPQRLITVSTGEKPYLLVNPRIVKREGEELADEGCLSFPGMVATIKRSLWVKVKGLNEEGKRVEVEVEGLLARVFQHEVDHLNGILIIDLAEPGTFRPLEKEEGEEIKAC